MRPVKYDRTYDWTHMLLSEPSALRWAQDIFAHYLSEAQMVTEIGGKKDYSTIRNSLHPAGSSRLLFG
jgi:hypothetical protein